MYFLLHEMESNNDDWNEDLKNLKNKFYEFKEYY